MGQLTDWLQSINQTKENLWGVEPYPRFIVNRCLSYHIDCLFQSLEASKIFVSDHQAYQIVLHSIPKRKRFAKWVKPETDELEIMTMRRYNCSARVARMYLDLVDETDLRKRINEGGKV